MNDFHMRKPDWEFQLCVLLDSIKSFMKKEMESIMKKVRLTSFFRKPG
jgi:energy-converting hydrogenase A subunit M